MIPPPPSQYRTRPYQDRFVDSVFTQLKQARSTLAVMATGLGKTVCFCHIAEKWANGRVIIMAHRDELIEQAAEKVWAITGQRPGIEKGLDRVDARSNCKVIVSSVQTLYKPDRLSKFNPADFGLLVIDEAHHAVAQTYLRVVDHFRKNPAFKTLGVTATPNRADELALGQVFETVAFDYGIEPASADGWLVKVLQRVVRVDGLDFSQCRTVAGDLASKDIEAIVNEEKMLHKVAAPTVELAGNRSTLVFCVTVEHARQMREVIHRYKTGSAEYLHGETPTDERRKIVQRFREGKIQFLCNVGVLLEGFDAPLCSCIAMARPTKSLGLYVQVIGRATRTLPGVLDGLDDASPGQRRAAIAASAKPDMLILDYVGNAGRHKIVNATDILGGKYAPEVRDYATKTTEEEGKSAGVEHALDRADAELALLKEEEERKRRVALEEARRRHIKAEADFRTQDVSPFGGATTRSANPGRPRQPWEIPTGGQINFLLYLGVSRATAESYTKKQASAVIDKLKKEKGIS